MNRIHWQGTRRATQLQDQISTQLQRWASEWFYGQWSQACALPVDDPTAMPDANRCVWSLSGSDGSTLWISAHSDAPEILARDALELPQGQGKRLVAEVGKHCIAALHSCLWGAEDVPAAANVAPTAFDAFRTRHGGLGWQLANLPGGFQIAVNNVWCRARLPADHERQAPLELVDRRRAIAPSRVRVDAAIELGSIELLDSLQLRVGEVLITDVSRQPSVVLSTPSGKLRTGRIAPEKAQRTVTLD